MEIKVSFPGGRRVNAQVDGTTIRTDQSVAHGGDGEAPEPFTLFLASLATCAGAYVSGFCANRKIDTRGIELIQHHRFDPDTHLPTEVSLEIRVPEDFPARYLPALERVAAKCTVKRALQSPPEFEIHATQRQAAA